MHPRDWIHEIAPIERVLATPSPFEERPTQTITELHQEPAKPNYHPRAAGGGFVVHRQRAEP